METRSVSFSPRQLVDSCAEGIRPQAGAKGLAVESDTSGCGSRLCLGDAFRIKQILDNIISNALKYTETGSVTVTVGQRPAENGIIMTASVIDTGVGIRAERLEQIFDKFDNDNSDDDSGSGLGLSISRELVRNA